VPETPEVLGTFGENLTTRGVLEADLNIGDKVRVGTALLQVTQPRMPCYKLQLRFKLLRRVLQTPALTDESRSMLLRRSAGRTELT